MEVFQHKTELEKVLQVYRRDKQPIGFVPTMGALHAGHLSLVRKSLEDNAITVVSIFVNPTQFDNTIDLEKYPENLEKDLQLLRKVSPKIIVFTPTAAEIYNGHVVSNSYDFEGLDRVMEGVHRSGHFNGVATVVELLFQAVKPQKAYFGEKDFQQLLIIKKLIVQKSLPIAVISCPIDRETNGLARSSRNERLTETTRASAGMIYETLRTAKTRFGTENALEIKEGVVSIFAEDPLFELAYFEIMDEATLTPQIQKQNKTKYRAFIAVYADGVRLIDNMALN